MNRTLTIANLFNKKHKIYEFKGIWGEILGETETNGAWIIFGKEKNGKTWVALLLAQYLSDYNRVLYISAEEGLGKNFTESCKRAKLQISNKNLHFLEYLSIEELRDKLSKQRSASIIFLDNITIFKDELQYGEFRKLLQDFPTKLFIFISHEDKKEPSFAVGKLVKKLAKVIFHVKGLAVNIAGRVPGGTLTIDETKAKIFHGNNI